VRSDYTYDQFGNQSRTAELGDVGVSGDERTIARTGTANTAVWLVDRPATEVVH